MACIRQVSHCIFGVWVRYWMSNLKALFQHALHAIIPSILPSLISTLEQNRILVNFVTLYSPIFIILQQYLTIFVRISKRQQSILLLKFCFSIPIPGTGNTEERNGFDSHSICQPINRSETEPVSQPEPSAGNSRSIELLSNQESCGRKQDDSRYDNDNNDNCNVKIKLHENSDENDIKIEEGKSIKSSPITVDINVRVVPRSGRNRPK